MYTKLASIIAGFVFWLGICQAAFSQQIFDDSLQRQNIAARIQKAYGIILDWRAYSLLNLADIEARLGVVSRLQREYGLVFDWRTIPLLTLVDIEARVGTAKRIEKEHGLILDWQQFPLLSLIDIETRLNTAKRLKALTGKNIGWQSFSLHQLLQLEQGLPQLDLGRIPLHIEPIVPPLSLSYPRSFCNARSRDEIKNELEEIDWEIRKLRRNVSEYDSDEYARKLKQLEWQLDELTNQARVIKEHSVADSLSDSSWDLRKLRREIEFNQSYFWGEREDHIDTRLRRIEWDLDDAKWELDK